MTKNQLQKYAFNIFRDFAATVAQKENISIEIKDETVLVNDLIAAISSAKKSLNKGEKKAFRQTDGYDIGFLLGFIQGNLNSRWISEYLLKQTNEYKEFTVLKAIKLFLKDNEIANIHMSNLYSQMLANGSNISYTSEEIIPFKIGNELLDNKDTLIGQNYIGQTLDNMINEYINGYLSKPIPDYVGELRSYFSTEEVVYLINNDFLS